MRHRHCRHSGPWPPPRPSRPPPPVLRLDDVHFYYSAFRAVKEVTIDIPTHQITALIGPSGCGKSTLLRTMNRMNDLIPGTRLTGRLEYHGQDLYASGVDPVEVRRRIGMVFQKPNPFPKSIYDNVAFGPRLTGVQGRPRRPRRAQPAPGRHLGRGQGQAQAVGAVAVGRSAAAAVHRPGDRDGAGGDPDGRAVLRPRPALDAPDRGADGRAQAELHDRHRHPQHAAGGARLRSDGVPDDGRGSRRATSSSRATRSTSSPTRRTS